MDFLCQKHRKLSEVVPVPEGLRELMADITREVLRFQPNNLEGFIAEYLEAMLLTRELCCIANRTVEDILDSSCMIAELLQKEGIPQDQVESAVKIVQEEFKFHAEEIGEKDPLKELNIINRLINDCDLSVEQAQKASGVIEDAWYHYYQRNKEHPVRLNPDVSQHEAVKNTLLVHQKSKATRALNESKKNLQTSLIGYSEGSYRESKTKIQKSIDRPSAIWRTPNFQNREKAAIKIQSWYRGLKDKKLFKSMQNAAKIIQKRFKQHQIYVHAKQQRKFRDSFKPIEEPLNPSLEESAVKIQACYRAYKIRKELKIKHKAATVIQSYVRGFLAKKNQALN